MGGGLAFPQVLDPVRVTARNPLWVILSESVIALQLGLPCRSLSCGGVTRQIVGRRQEAGGLAWGDPNYDVPKAARTVFQKTSWPWFLTLRARCSEAGNANRRFKSGVRKGGPGSCGWSGG